jgi:hypothetical protein
MYNIFNFAITTAMLQYWLVSSTVSQMQKSLTS